MSTLSKQASELVADLKKNDLSRTDLKYFFRLVKTNFIEINSFTDLEDFKNVGTLLMVMLESDDFEDDPDRRQSMAALGFYTLSKGIYTLTLDSFGVNKLDRIPDYLDLLKIRLLLLKHSNASIKYTLSLLPSEEDISSFTMLMGESSSNSGKQYSLLLVTDAVEIKKFGSSPVLSLFHGESINLANSILASHAKMFPNQTAKDVVSDGKKLGRELFTFLDERFSNERNFDFE